MLLRITRALYRYFLERRIDKLGVCPRHGVAYVRKSVEWYSFTCCTYCLEQREVDRKAESKQILSDAFKLYKELKAIR